MKCKICDHPDDLHLFTAREMMFGLRDEFEYGECPECGCVQLAEIPKNIDKYYPKDYYSFEVKHPGWLEKFVKKQIALYRWKKTGQLGKLLQPLYPRYLLWLNPKCHVTFSSRILDVGTGSGKLLRELHHFGFKNLIGIDPYIESDKKISDGLMVYKRDIFDVVDQYDLVMMHHSFEHMTDPGEIFSKLRDTLNPNGRILIRIPVADSKTFQKYRENWAELDPPRHFFIHTVRSIEILAEEYDLEVDHILHDSSAFELIESEKWSQDIPSIESPEILTQKQRRNFDKEIDQLNAGHLSGRACFYLKAKSLGLGK